MYKKQLNYFRFVWKNWNLRLAIFSIIHEIRGEKKYRIDTTAIDDLKSLNVDSENKRHAYIYQPVNYFMLEAAFNFLKEEGIQGGLVDFGSGQGRILAVAAHYGFERITGIDFAPYLCDKARENLRMIQSQFINTEVEVVCGDATHYEIKKTDSVFVFFNPFDNSVMLPVVKNILASIKKVPRAVTIVYFNPTEKEIFQSAGFREIWYFEKMEYLDFSILQKDAEG